MPKCLQLTLVMGLALALLVACGPETMPEDALLPEEAVKRGWFMTEARTSGFDLHQKATTSSARVAKTKAGDNYYFACEITRQDHRWFKVVAHAADEEFLLPLEGYVRERDGEEWSFVVVSILKKCPGV